MRLHSLLAPAALASLPFTFYPFALSFILSCVASLLLVYLAATPSIFLSTQTVPRLLFPCALLTIAIFLALWLHVIRFPLKAKDDNAQMRTQSRLQWKPVNFDNMANYVVYKIAYNVDEVYLVCRNPLA